jgi:hypothetical protein
MTALMVFVLLVVFGPMLIIVPSLLILCGVGMFAAGHSRRARRTFECPVRHRRVTADFVVPVGAARPESVSACSAFADPTRVTCTQGCLEAAEVHWSAPVSLFGRWALVSDGIAHVAEGAGLAPQPPAKAA